jgi:hypothetical protein
MGGGYYDRDVSEVASAQQYSAEAEAVLRAQRETHQDLSPFQRTLNCTHKYLMGVTSSHPFADLLL